MRTALLAAAVAVTAIPAAADARMSVVYDTAYDTGLLVGLQPDGAPGLGQAEGFVQQQPVAAVLPASAQAWKVQSRGPTSTTPGLAGRGAAGIAQLLTDRIRRSGAHLVFVDEIAAAMGPGTARELAAALAAMGATPSPWGGTYADRVHLYVPTPAFLLRDPTTWDGAWSAMARAGGVWLQTYRSPLPTTPWGPPEWLAWPRALAERIVAGGGSPDRLHLLMSTSPDQRAQWQWARTGAACAWLANGPGAYRLDNSVTQWVAEFRATFGTEPAPAGPSSIACAPAPVPDTARAMALARLLSGAEPTSPPRAARMQPRQLVVGATQALTVDLGPDPAGIGAALGMPPGAAMAAAGARVVIRGPGFTRSVWLGSRRAVTVRVKPTERGPVGASLVLGGAALTRAWAGGDLDVLATIDAGGGAPTARQAAAVNPRGWSIAMPIGPPPAVVTARPSRVTLARMGLARARRAGINTRRADGWIATVRDQAGRAMPGIAITARLPSGRGLKTRTGRGGMAVIRVPRRTGRLTVRVAMPGPKVMATRVVTPGRGGSR